MISLTLNHCVMNNKITPIKRWEVWFQTPFGITNNLQEAVDKVQMNDMDPEFMILPVPVAINEKNDYEIFTRR